MKSVFALTKAYISLLVKDKMTLFWFLAFPLLFVLLFGYVVPNVGNQHDMVILAEGENSKLLTDQLMTFPRTMIDEDMTLNKGKTELENGNISILISITEERVDFHYLKEEEKWVKNIQQAITPNIGQRKMDSVTYEGVHKIEPIDFIMPGMIGLTIMQIGLFGGTSLLEDRSKQILRRLKISGIKPWQVILSHILSRLVMVLFSTLVLILFGRVILGVPLQFEFWYTQFLFIILGGFVFLSLGLLIASILKSPEAGNILSQSVNFLMAFICGIFIPLTILPKTVQSVVSFLPLTPLVEMLRSLFLGAAIEPVTLMMSSLILLFWGFASFILGSLLFKWE